MTRVILVDEQDTELGIADRDQAHKAGKLHRAVSVFILNGVGELLLQRRASTKALFAGKWANTCCTHPRAGESVIQAGERRLLEEMSLEVSLGSVGTFLYHARDAATGYIEHELDHVLVGHSENDPVLNPDEADAFIWADLVELRGVAGSDPGYAPWLGLALAAFPSLGA